MMPPPMTATRAVSVMAPCRSEPRCPRPAPSAGPRVSDALTEVRRPSARPRAPGSGCATRSCSRYCSRIFPPSSIPCAGKNACTSCSHSGAHQSADALEHRGGRRSAGTAAPSSPSGPSRTPRRGRAPRRSPASRARRRARPGSGSRRPSCAGASGVMSSGWRNAGQRVEVALLLLRAPRVRGSARGTPRTRPRRRSRATIAISAGSDVRIHRPLVVAIARVELPGLAPASPGRRRARRSARSRSPRSCRVELVLAGLRRPAEARQRPGRPGPGRAPRAALRASSSIMRLT